MYHATETLWDSLVASERPLPREWAQLEAVRRRIARKITGDERETEWAYVARKYFGDRRPVDRVLSMGCGGGWLERELASQGLFKACDAIDISGESIAIARAAAERAGLSHLSYQQGNLDTWRLPVGSYDAVFASATLHHLFNLEFVFSQVSSALRPGGIFVVNEYVGPSRFQFSDRELEAINAAIFLLPPEYRRLVAGLDQITALIQMGDRRELARAIGRRLLAKVRSGNLLPLLQRRARRWLRNRRGQTSHWTPVRRISVAEQEAADPSEAVRSAEILPLLESQFEIVERTGYGGTILQLGLSGIAENFAASTPQAAALLEMLMDIEDTLIGHGDLNSHFAFVVARPRT